MQFEPFEKLLELLPAQSPTPEKKCDFNFRFPSMPCTPFFCQPVKKHIEECTRCKELIENGGFQHQIRPRGTITCSICYEVTCFCETVQLQGKTCETVVHSIMKEVEKIEKKRTGVHCFYCKRQIANFVCDECFDCIRESNEGEKHPFPLATDGRTLCTLHATRYGFDTSLFVIERKLEKQKIRDALTQRPFVEWVFE